MDQFFEDEVDMYLVKDQNSQEVLRKHSFSLEKSNDNLQTYKTKMNSEANRGSVKGSGKGKYIEKLKKISNNNESVAMSELQQGCSLHELSKRQRNRISAKQSRDRKKLYIELMEYGQKKLEKELEEVSREIEDTKNKINQFCTQNKTNVGFSTKSQLEGKLERILSNNLTSSSQDQINILLDCISFRIGGTGRDRIHKQNQFYKQIINLSLPALHRYLMWAATENKHVFTSSKNEPGENEEFGCPLLQKYHIWEENEQKMSNLKDNIIEMKKKLIELIEKLWLTKSNVQSKIKELEQELGGIREILTPIQAAKFILFASRNKYRKDLNFFEEDNMTKEVEELQMISKPSKRVKKQDQSV